MAPSRAMQVLLVLVATSALAGCNVKNWYNQEGIVHVALAPVGPQESALNDFRSLKVGILGVSIKQLGTVSPKNYAFPDGPLMVDLVAAGRAGETIPLTQEKFNIRAIESVTITLQVLEAIDAAGKVLPNCHPGEPAESKPCVSTPINGAYRSAEKSFSVPRGGEVKFDFPLAVQYGDREYFIQHDPSLVVIEKL